MGAPRVVPQAVFKGQWLWPENTSSEAKREALKIITKKDPPEVVESLGQCLEPLHEANGMVRESCAEKLLDLAPKRGVGTLWGVVKRQLAQGEDPLEHYAAKGLLLGVLAVHYARRRQPQRFARIEKWVHGPGIPATDVTRHAMLTYIVRHPHEDLVDYALEGLHNPGVRFVTTGFLPSWPYSPRLAEHVLAVFEKSNPQWPLVKALGRWKAQEARPLFRSQLGLDGHAPIRDQDLSCAMAFALAFDLKDKEGLKVLERLKCQIPLNGTKK